jgi:hypothetical protein
VCQNFKALWSCFHATVARKIAASKAGGVNVMDMDMEQIEKAVKQFKSDFLEGSFTKSTSPNNGQNYRDELEAKDHEAFEGYVNSQLFRVLNNIEK